MTLSSSIAVTRALPPLARACVVVLALSAGAVAGCGGGGGGGGGSNPPPSEPASDTTLRDVPPSIQRYAGTWKGCLSIGTAETAASPLRNLTSYTFTPLGGNRVQVDALEERFQSPDCTGTAPVGARSSRYTLAFEDQTVEIDVASVGSVKLDRLRVLSLESERLAGDFPLVLNGVPPDLQWAITEAGGELRVTPMARWGTQPSALIDGVLRKPAGQ